MNKIEEVKKILGEPVTCEDGNAHFIDENDKRFLAGEICQLFEQVLKKQDVVG